MIDSLEIRGFRCFDHLEVKGLARVNLLVGSNNGGKTSLLEAIELCATRAAPDALETLLVRRDEPPAAVPPGSELSVRHLFHGHALEPGQSFAIAASENGASVCVQAGIEDRPGFDDATIPGHGPLHLTSAELANVEPRKSSQVFRVDVTVSPSDNNAPPPGYAVRLTAKGDLPARVLPQLPRFKSRPPVMFVPARSLPTGMVGLTFGEIALTDEESFVMEAMKIIDPGIERVALVTPDLGPSTGSGLYLRCKSEAQRIPIGSMGDGIWRLLTLALGLVKTRGGILLVDEIDTGLHFSALYETWKLIIETTQRLDVQVFATMHSRDCYESLAAVLRDLETAPGTAVIHRIERERGRTVAFNEQQIIIAAERDIEVR